MLWAGQLSSVRGTLARVELAGSAADHPAVAAALGAFVEAWSGTAAAMDEGTRDLGAKLEASAGAYERTDRSQFPRE